MRFTITEREMHSRADRGHWSGHGLFYAVGGVYLKTEDGRIFDTEGFQVFLPDNVIVRPLKIVGGEG